MTTHQIISLILALFGSNVAFFYLGCIWEAKQQARARRIAAQREQEIEDARALFELQIVEKGHAIACGRGN